MFLHIPDDSYSRIRHVSLCMDFLGHIGAYRFFKISLPYARASLNRGRPKKLGFHYQSPQRAPTITYGVNIHPQIYEEP